MRAEEAVHPPTESNIRQRRIRVDPADAHHDRRIDFRGAGAVKDLRAFVNCGPRGLYVVDEQQTGFIQVHPLANRERPANVRCPLAVAEPNLMRAGPSALENRQVWTGCSFRYECRQGLGGM